MKYVIRKIGLALSLHKYKAMDKIIWELEPQKKQYVVMTGSEFTGLKDKMEGLRDQIRTLESESWETREYHAEEIRRLKYALEKEREEVVSQEFSKGWNKLQEKKKIIAKQNDEIVDLKDQIAKLTAWKDQQTNYLRRIANVGDHINETGYAVTGIMQVVETVNDAYDSRREVVWKVTLSTPYPVTMPIRVIEETIYEDLAHVLTEMGVQEMRFSPDEYPEDDNDNVAYRYMFRGSVRSGFWEVDIWTTSEVVIPSHMLPEKRSKQKKRETREE